MAAENTHAKSVAAMSDEEIHTPIRATMNEVATVANQGLNALNLMSAVEDVAKAEGVARARVAFRNGGKARLTDELLRGADDTWSGRGRNEVNRIAFDAFRDEARLILTNRNW